MRRPIIEDGEKLLADYLHGFAPPEAHHFHLEAPPDQHEVGRSLRLDADDAGCVGSGGDPSAIFGASAAFGASILGLGRESEASLGGRGELFKVSALAAPLSACGTLAGGLA